MGVRYKPRKGINMENKSNTSPEITYIIRKEWWSYDGRDFVDAEDLDDQIFTNLGDAIAVATKLNQTEAHCFEALPGIWETCSFCIMELTNGEQSDIVMEAEKMGFVKSKGDLSDRPSVVDALRTAYDALTALYEAWDHNSEGINLNEIDSAVNFYPFDRDFGEVVNSFGTWVSEVEDSIKK